MHPTDETTRGRTAKTRRGARGERTFPGRLVAITATGPIYEAPVTFTLLPISCVLALHQELAARTINRHARVVSSLADRVHGDRAYATWSAQTLAFSTALSQASPAARVVVNAAWPWLAPQQFEATLHFVQRVLHRATFTDKVATPVVDPNLRTISAIAAGRFKTIDVIEWLKWYKFDISNWQLGGVRTSQLPGENDPSPSDLLHDGPGDRTPGAPRSPWDIYGPLPGSSGSNGTSRRGDGPWLAEDYILLNEIDLATEIATHVLELGNRVNSARIDERLRHLARLLRHYKDLHAVTSFLDQYKDQSLQT